MNLDFEICWTLEVEMCYDSVADPGDKTGFKNLQTDVVFYLSYLLG